VNDKRIGMFKFKFRKLVPQELNSRIGGNSVLYDFSCFKFHDKKDIPCYLLTVSGSRDYDNFLKRKKLDGKTYSHGTIQYAIATCNIYISLCLVRK